MRCAAVTLSIVLHKEFYGDVSFGVDKHGITTAQLVPGNTEKQQPRWRTSKQCEGTIEKIHIDHLLGRNLP